MERANTGDAAWMSRTRNFAHDRAARRRARRVTLKEIVMNDRNHLPWLAALVVCASTCLPARAASDLPAFPTGAYVSGKIAMKVDPQGHVRVTEGMKVLVDGEFSVKADEIRLTDKSGPMACLTKGQETGVYRWHYTGGKLTLSKIEDRCEGRVGDLTAQPWTPAPAG